MGARDDVGGGTARDRHALTRVIVCGGRHFAGQRVLARALDRLLAKHPDMVIVHGAASGADHLAAGWAERRGVPDEPHPADGEHHDNKAGPVRNQAMLETGVDGVVAFPGDRGTTHMTRIAREAGVAVWFRVDTWLLPKDRHARAFRAFLARQGDIVETFEVRGGQLVLHRLR